MSERSGGNMTRNGKIARLPYKIRMQLNLRLEEGATGIEAVAWLNKQWQVKDAERGGCRPVCEPARRLAESAYIGILHPIYETVYACHERSKMVKIKPNQAKSNQIKPLYFSGNGPFSSDAVARINRALDA